MHMRVALFDGGQQCSALIGLIHWWDGMTALELYHSIARLQCFFVRPAMRPK